MEHLDARTEAIARRALERLGPPPSATAYGATRPVELRIAGIDMPQLVRLVYLQAGEPLVDQVLAALKAGRPVYLDRPATETALGLAEYPRRLQEQFNRWFSRLAGYGIALVGQGTSQREGFVGQAPSPASDLPVRYSPRPEAAPPRDALVHSSEAQPSPAASALVPERQIFSEILGDAVPEPHPCVMDPSRVCSGSGQCKTLGY